VQFSTHFRVKERRNGIIKEPFTRIHQYVMITRFLTITGLICCLWLPPAQSQSQEPVSVDEDSLRVGLVLSGGGMRGVAHLGVIKAIEEAGLRVDYISGTSMGSLIGGLYAIGYTADQLIDIAQTNNFMELFTERANRRHISNYEKGFDQRTIVSFPIGERGINLPAGIITGQNIYAFLSRLSWPVHNISDFDEFPIPYAAIGTDLETGDAKVFRSGYLPDAIRASISLPSAMAPHRIDDRYYIDGGLARNLPVQDVIDMGANYVIAVDVSSPLVSQDSLRSLTEIMNQSVLYRINERTALEKEKADMVITMDELNHYFMMDLDRIDTFLGIGLEQGQRFKEQFRELAARQNPVQVRPGISPPEPIRIEDVIIEGNTLFDDDFVKRMLEFEPGIPLSPYLIEQKISRLYSSQYIEQVTYRVIPGTEPETYKLRVQVFENKRNDFKVGLRYETQTQASILLEATFQDMLHPGSINRFDLRLGNELRFSTDYIYYGALGSSLAALTSIQYTSEQVDWYQESQRVSSFNHRVLRGEVSVGNYFSSSNLISIGVRNDFRFHTDRINPDEIDPVSEDYFALFSRYKFDRLNRKVFPTSGQRIIAQAYHSNPALLSPLLFSALSFYWEGHLEVTNDFTLRSSAYSSYTYGDDLPWEYWSTPNRYDEVHGIIRFGGFSRYEIASRNIQMGSFGFQVEPLYHRFIGFDVYAGRFLDEWDISLTNDDIEYGASVTVGAQTILGPLQAILSTSTRHSFKAELQIGYQF
jgi:NTE family protein